MKTPEELAEEYAQTIETCCGTSDIIIAAETAFFAGYKAAQQWISVKDRLPEHFEDVLTFEDGECYRVNSISQLTKYWWDSDEGFERNPSHWMPLPAPPKEEK